MLLRPKNWSEYQHYKDRSPPWVKLHRGLLDDRVFQRLPDASRALAPMLWLLASEKAGGVFDGSPEEIAFRLRTTADKIERALNPLIESGLFEVASAMLAPRKRSACLEGEGESETEQKLSAGADRASDLKEFLRAYKPPRNAKPADTRKAWGEVASIRRPLSEMVAAAVRYNEWLEGEWKRNKKQYPQKQHPATWLRGEVWNSFLDHGAALVDVNALGSLWDGKAAPLVAEIGGTKFLAWFSEATFEAGPPAKLIFEKQFQANWVSQYFEKQLRAALGEFSISVAKAAA